MTIVSFDDFATEFSKNLEISNDNFKKSLLKDVPEYDSMGKITVGFLIEELFDFEISYEKLNNVDTLSSLYDYCIQNTEKKNKVDQ